MKLYAVECYDDGSYSIVEFESKEGGGHVWVNDRVVKLKDYFGTREAAEQSLLNMKRVLLEDAEKIPATDPELEKLKDQMAELRGSADVEGAHVEADKLLVRALLVVGTAFKGQVEDLIEQYDAIEKWCA